MVNVQNWKHVFFFFRCSLSAVMKHKVLLNVKTVVFQMLHTIISIGTITIFEKAHIHRSVLICCCIESVFIFHFSCHMEFKRTFINVNNAYTKKRLNDRWPGSPCVSSFKLQTEFAISKISKRRRKITGVSSKESFMEHLKHKSRLLWI